MKPLDDPLIQRLRQMCMKDKIVQSLYQNKILWSDVPSDDDELKLDDWKSYEMMEKRAKEAYLHHISTQRSKTKKNSQIASNHTRKHRALAVVPVLPVSPALIPVIPVVPVVPVVKKEIVENHIVYQPPIEYEEMDVVPSTELTEPAAHTELVTKPITEIIPYQPDTEGSDRGSLPRWGSILCPLDRGSLLYIFLLIILIYIMMRMMRN